VVEMQRRRVLAAAVEVVAKEGVGGCSVALVCSNGGVSRKTFYEVFRDREECLAAAFEMGVQDARGRIATALGGSEHWREQVRLGLGALLSFLDGEPAMARLLVVEALSAGQATLRAREAVLDELATCVGKGATLVRSQRGDPPPLTAEGVVGAVFSVIHARMLREDGPPLGALLAALMATIVHPYLGPAAARAELDRASEQVRSKSPANVSPFKDLPIRLTYRTAQVLNSIGAAPGASSRRVATAAGIVDAGQASRLLIRLEKAGLISNGSDGTRGAPKEWTLTGLGDNVLRVLSRD
jgi:AcrR family transcriptional regulator